MQRRARPYLIVGGIFAAIMLAQALLTQYEWWIDLFDHEVNIPRAYIISILAIAILTVMYLSDEVLRLKSPPIIFANGRDNHNPTLDVIVSVGSQCMMTTGGKAAGFGDREGSGTSSRGKDGTLILPKDAFRRVGQALIIDGYRERVALDELPPLVQARIASEPHIYRPPYYLIETVRFTSTHRPDLAEQLLEQRKKSSFGTQALSAARSTVRAVVTNNRILVHQNEKGRPEWLERVKLRFQNDDEPDHADR